jgi:hypothetical protein
MSEIKMRMTQTQMPSKLHELIHALHEAEKWLEKVKKLVDEMVKENDNR